jgi:small-conductance mechanosensitive channel
VRRPASYLALVLSAAAGVGAVAVDRYADAVDWPVLGGTSTRVVAVKSLSALAVVLLVYGLYLLVVRAVESWSESKQRAHDVRGVLRLAFLLAAVVGVLGVVTEQWVGLLFSAGILGFAATFALQQPLLSLIGWVYILLKRPYEVGDRVRIGEARGDVIEVDFLVTTLWEVGGDLVSGHQPSGRMVTVPNSLVLSSTVYNYSLAEFPFVWNELAVQVSYETDLAFAREEMAAVADDLLGDEMERRVGAYREALAETPVELEVNDRPTVNVAQEESWVELRLRYLTHPKRMQRTRNQLYERILARFREHPDRVSFPVGRFR